MSPSKYKLIIFDWDGTLVDSIDRIATSLQAASFQICQIDVSHSDARSVIGLGLQEAVEKLHPELSANTISQISEAYKQHYLNENTITEDPFDGVAELLTQLNDSGYLLAIATGKSRVGLERSVNKFDLKELFHTTQCASENQSKPHPEMLYKILDELKVSANEALMIGDSKHDLKMAINANMDAIAVTHGVNTAEELSGFNPLACLDRVTDLHHFLQHNKHP